MKKYIVIFMLFFTLTALPMQLIQNLHDWRNDRKADCFLQDFGSKKCIQMSQDSKAFSCNVLKKIFKKTEEKHWQCSSGREQKLFKGTVLFALLPYDMQKTILTDLDDMFIDPEMVKIFLNRPIRRALQWATSINRKVGSDVSYLFKERKLFGEQFTSELTKSQLFEMSLDEVLLLEHIKSSDRKIKIIDDKKTMNKAELVALEGLMKKGYVSREKSAGYTVIIKFDDPWDYSWPLLKKGMMDIVIPFFVCYYTQKYFLVGVDPLDNQKRMANNALQELEVLGKGPYLKFEFNYLCSFKSIFKYFLIKLCSLGINSLVYANALQGKSIKNDDVFNLFYKIALPGVICFAVLGSLVRSVFADVKVDDFNFLPFFYLVANAFVVIFTETNCIDCVIGKSKFFDTTVSKTVTCAEIGNYLKNRWIYMR